MEHTILPAVSVALIRDGKALLVKRARPPAQGVYAFPGGRVEPGEDDIAAARRELLEETGLTAGTLAFIEEVRTEPEPHNKAPGYRLRVFAASDAAGVLAAADDAAEAAFFSLAEMEHMPLADRVLPIVRRLLGQA